MCKTHGLTLKEAASKVSSADFTPNIMIRNQTKLAETTPNTNALMAEIRKLNSKIAELETLATTEQTKGGFWSRLFRN